MRYRTLGKTGLSVSEIALGAGPVSGLMTGTDQDRQLEVVARALRNGINWLDTAPGYGAGKSEENLGRCLQELRCDSSIHVATKVRLLESELTDIRSAVRRSVEQSLTRLKRPRVTLLQLHNAITSHRNDEPSSITPEDLLGQGGVLDAFEELQEEGICSHFGLTGIGTSQSLRQVIQTNRVQTIQIPFNWVNPSADQFVPDPFSETDYGQVIRDAASSAMGVFAIRVFAAGALLDQEPSPHTLKTPYFPLNLYQRDRQQMQRIRQVIEREMSMTEFAIRFGLTCPRISSCILGLASTQHIEDAVQAVQKGPLPVSLLKELNLEF